jgi:ferredoxin
MEIDPRKCVACGNCLPVCPVGAIQIDPRRRRARISLHRCVECYTCFRGLSTENLNPTLIRALRRLLGLLRLRFDPEPDVCPTAAIVPQELSWPRIVRRAFSDPLVPHESTGIHGRGTEEVKTNDVTGRIDHGEAGFTVEFGRPTIGTSFAEIQEVTHRLARENVTFEAHNPVTALMSDSSSGTIRPDILEERILSAIVEFKTRLDCVPDLLRTIEEAARSLGTVVQVGVSTRCDSEGESPLENLLPEAGYDFTRGKTNLGLARVRAPRRSQSGQEN